MARALVVDPNSRDLSFLETILEREGWEVTGAGSVPRACERLGQKTFDLVVIAQSMEGRAGLALATAIRSRKVPVLMTVGDDETPFRAEGLDVSVVTKPFYVDRFMAAVQAAVSPATPVNGAGERSGLAAVAEEP